MIVKRFFKGIFAINVIFIISAMSVSLYSCQNEDVANAKVSQQEAATFMDKSIELLAQFMQADVVVKNKTIQCVEQHTVDGDTTSLKNENNLIPTDGTKTVYVVFPEGTSQNVKNLYSEIMSVQDMAILERMTAAEFTTMTPPDSAYAFQMSEEKVKEELTPMTQASIKYLTSFGVSTLELIEMVTELNTDITSLIPLALVIAEYQMNEAIKNLPPLMGYNPFTFLATPTFANEYDAQIFLDCAMKAAIGFSLEGISRLGISQAITLSVMKTALKSILIKTMGVIGVVITVAHFTNCMLEKGKCVFAITAPSDFENKLNDAIGNNVLPKDKIPYK